MAFKIEVVEDDCIGCGACAAQCDNFEVVDGKAKPKEAQVDEVGCNQDAADVCPVNCIKVEEVGGAEAPKEEEAKPEAAEEKPKEE